MHTHDTRIYANPLKPTDFDFELFSLFYNAVCLFLPSKTTFYFSVI